MQTFLPYPSFKRSATALDRMRLGKQRVETYQIMGVLLGLRIDGDEVVEHDPKGWSNHPAVRMWRGHESWLMGYQSSVCAEWASRGYKDTCFDKTHALYIASGYREDPKPAWLGSRRLHRSHQSNLLRKDSEHYSLLFKNIPDDLPYVWPVD